jgi:hypothetical protein
MKLLGRHNRLTARPASDAAPAGARPDAPAKATPQWREWCLTPRAALAALLFVTVVLLCEPDGVLGWIKTLAAGVIIPGGVYAIVKTATGEWRLLE